MDIEKRIESLEKKLLFHKRLWMGAASLFAVAVAIWATKPVPKVIEGEKFELKDSTGKTRGIWEMDKEWPDFSLLDKNGGSLLRLGGSEIGSSLIIYGTGGKRGVQLGVFRVGPENKEEPGIYLRDKDGKGRLFLTIKNEEPSVFLLDPNEKTRAHWGMSPDGPFMAMWGPSRKRGVSVGVTQKGAGLFVSDSKGKIRFFTGTDREEATGKEAPGVLLRDEKGKSRARLLFKDGVSVLVLSDSNGTRRTALTQEKKDGPSLFLFNEKGDIIWGAPPESK